VELRNEALALVRARYADFGPTLAQEKLLEQHDIRVAPETLRQWMIGRDMRISARRWQQPTTNNPNNPTHVGVRHWD
jgi:hypothetical protein